MMEHQKFLEDGIQSFFSGEKKIEIREVFSLQVFHELFADPIIFRCKNVYSKINLSFNFILTWACWGASRELSHTTVIQLLQWVCVKTFK